MSKIIRLGIDLGKNTFHVCAMDRAGHVVLAKRFTRRGLEQFLRTHEPCVVGLEACGGRIIGRACWGRWAMTRG